MKYGSIISEEQALNILRNERRRVALEKHAVELNSATAERRAEILAQIAREIEDELSKRARRFHPDILLH
ncbi:MAG TPA: hypothetical protein VEC99_18945 [Clostridia bacterium]|nr:hypothetical protein [Clostridia bacterium]